MRDQHPDGRTCGAGRGLRQHVRAQAGQVQALRPYAGGRCVRQGAADRRMLCGPGMQGRRHHVGGEILFFHSRGASSLDRHQNKRPADDTSSRQRRLHGCGQDDQVAFEKELAIRSRAPALKLEWRWLTSCPLQLDLPCTVPIMTTIDALPGLSQDEAALRLARDGPNELSSAKPRSLFAIAAKVVLEPMFLLLIACGAIYLLLGDRTGALMLLGFVLVVVSISFFQERKTERALEALRDLSSPRALVMRDGEQRRIAGREVVRGDLLVLSEGDRVPADAVLLSGLNLSADESLLTGESVPVRKTPAAHIPEVMAKPGGDDLPFLYSGTLVVQGKGLAQTLATGQHTAIGRIGKELAAVEQEPTRIQQETARIVKRLAWLGIALSLAVAVAYALMRGDWLNGFLVGITLAMAILPEELPVVMTIFLGLGAWRMAQQRVLTRHIPAIEMLGSATVLCVDKTGTLTQNRMALVQLQAHDSVLDLSRLEGAELPEQFHELLEFSML